MKLVLVSIAISNNVVAAKIKLPGKAKNYLEKNKITCEQKNKITRKSKNYLEKNKITCEQKNKITRKRTKLPRKVPMKKSDLKKFSPAGKVSLKLVKHSNQPAHQPGKQTHSNEKKPQTKTFLLQYES